MFRGYTQRAQRILMIDAQDETRKFNSDKLQPEHIILAIIKDEKGTACKILNKQSIELSDFEKEIAKNLNSVFKNASFSLGDLPSSPRTKKILSEASSEAALIGDKTIGTEHIVLACINEKDSTIKDYLNTKGLTYDIFKKEIFSFLKRPQNNIEDSFEKKRRTFTNPQRIAQTPTLDEYSRNLTEAAKNRELQPVIGRDIEIQRVIRILSRKSKNNPVLIGEPGVGKTAIAEGLAQDIVNNRVPDILFDKKVLVLDLASLIAGTKYRGEFEDRLKKVMREIKNVKDVILFIDELHTLIGAGGAEGAIDASNMLKPALSRSEIQCIGATTFKEYRKYIEKDAALERRFQPVLIEEPNEVETLKILQGIKKAYEKHHNVIYSNEALHAAVYLSKRYVTDRFLPDKAIDLIDEAGSKKRIETHCFPDYIAQYENEIKELKKKKENIVKAQDYEEAATVRDRINNLEIKIEKEKEQWIKNSRNTKEKIEKSDIQEIVSSITKIPLKQLKESEINKLIHLEKELSKQVIGQHEAINLVSSALRKSATGVKEEDKPLGSFVFSGSTGIGKTLLAKIIAEIEFGSKDNLIRIDMSDYMEKYNVSRLIGAPPGYVGHEEGGVLEVVRKRPYSVILFDEIEKAHPDIFNILLQILEEGELKDSLGHVISFRNTIIIMTTNLGTKDISVMGDLGFNPQNKIPSYKDIKNTALKELKKYFKIEFINRIDQIVVFKPLDKEDCKKIARIEFDKLIKRIKKANDIIVNIDNSLIDYIVNKGYDLKYGARAIKRCIQNEIEDPLAIKILKNNFDKSNSICIKAKNDKIELSNKKQKIKKEVIK